MVDIDFKFLEFYTYYSSEGDIDKDLSREWCFSTIFDGDETMCNTYELYIYRYGYKFNGDNNCLITKRQLIQHIEEIKKFHDFDYTIENINKGYKLQFTINAPLMWHKIILSWLRYSYEFPFNIALYEAFKIKKKTDFKNETLLNLFNLIGATIGCTRHGTGIHAIGNFYDFKKLISYKDFTEAVEEFIEEDCYGAINCIIPTVKNIELKNLEFNLNYRCNHTDYWKNENLYKERLKIYKHNLNIIKQY